MVQKRDVCLTTLKALHLQPASVSFLLIKNRTESKICYTLCALLEHNLRFSFFRKVLRTPIKEG